jgi:hypothetical protein
MPPAIRPAAVLTTKSVPDDSNDTRFSKSTLPVAACTRRNVPLAAPDSQLVDRWSVPSTRYCAPFEVSYFSAVRAARRVDREELSVA